LKIKGGGIQNSDYPMNNFKPQIETAVTSTKNATFRTKRSSVQKGTTSHSSKHHQIQGGVMSEPCSLPQSTKARAMISLCKNTKSTLQK
jgi:hypothetical protein